MNFQVSAATVPIKKVLEVQQTVVAQTLKIDEIDENCRKFTKIDKNHANMTRCEKKNEMLL